MREQSAILLLDHGEWIFVADDEESARTWTDFETAIMSLNQEGWEIVQGPALIQSEI
jgi:hypothetical protein